MNQSRNAARDTASPVTPDPSALAGIDTSVAHSARVYDYILGGTANFPADRAAADAAQAANPHLATAMRENRALLRRVTAFLAGDAGIRQFLDIGAGLPTSPNVHEVAQSLAPESRVVYVDHDPIVIAYSQALPTTSDRAKVAYINADIRHPAEILAHPSLRETLDLAQPIALIIFGTLQFVPDSDEPYRAVARLTDALVPGSYLAIQHPTAEFYPEGAGVAAAYQRSGIAFRYRNRDEFTRFLDGFAVVPPGIVPMAQWRAESEPQPRPAAVEAAGYAAVARKNEPSDGKG